MINQLASELFLLLAIAAIIYILILRSINAKLKNKLFIKEVDDEIQRAKDKAYNSPLDDLVDESNKEFSDGKRNKS